MMGAPLDGAGLQRIVELAGSGLHLAFQAGDRAAVERFHSAALQAGGVDNGTPGVRTYGAGYYAAYVRDPDGKTSKRSSTRGNARSAGAIEVETP